VTEKPIFYMRVRTLPDGTFGCERIDEIVPGPDEFGPDAADRPTPFGDLVVDSDAGTLMFFADDPVAYQRTRVWIAEQRRRYGPR
jgi:hypothetical protein